MLNPTTVHFSPVGFAPTEEQRKIQASRSRISLVVANAGAAKTTTLALRIGESLNRGIPAEEILGLTFTTEAKDVLKTRLVDIGIAYKIAKRVHIQTIEEFSKNILSKFEDSEPRSIQSARDQRTCALSALEALTRKNPGIADQLDTRTHNVAISHFLRHLLKLKATMTLALDEEGLDAEDIAERLSIPVTDYLWAVEYERTRIDIFESVQFRAFFDATYDLASILRTNPDLTAGLPSYKLIVCDEFHDVNEASFCIIETLLKTHRTYFVGVGDRDQVIYSDLGADESFIRYRLSSSFPDCVKFPLTATYRHGPHLAYAMAEFKQKQIESNIPLRTEICEVTYPADAHSCGSKVAAAVRDWEDRGKPLENCCILLRDTHQSIEIETALIQANVPYRTLAMKSYLHRDEILFLRGMLAIALGNFHHIESTKLREAIVEALATFCEIPMSARELDEAKSTINESPAAINYFFEGQIKRTGNPSVRARMEKAISYIRTMDSGAPCHVALKGVCENMDIESLAKRLYIHPYEASVITKSINGFIESTQSLGITLQGFSDWIGATEISASRNPNKGKIILERAEQAKGREFDHVIIPFLEADEFPNPFRSLSEEENLFYVAATRAKFRLTLVVPDDKTRRSTFVSRMQLNSAQHHADNALRRNLLIPEQRPSLRDLRVAYANKDIVKALGAQWDKTRKVWYVPDGMDLRPFENWLIKK